MTQCGLCVNVKRYLFMVVYVLLFGSDLHSARHELWSKVEFNPHTFFYAEHILFLLNNLNVDTLRYAVNNLLIWSTSTFALEWIKKKTVVVALIVVVCLLVHVFIMC